MRINKADVERLALYGIKKVGPKRRTQVNNLLATITPLKQGRSRLWDIVFTATGVGEVGHIWSTMEPDRDFLYAATITEPAHLARNLRARPAPIGFYV